MARETTAQTTTSKGWGLLVLLGAAAGLLLADLALIFLWVPTEITMGVVQRIFYFHVPAALVGFIGFFIVFIASIGYLVKRTRGWDRVAQSAAEVGVVFLSVAIVSGAIWAKPVWGTWWTWDPKLTTTFILWVIYLGYLMVRAYTEGKEQGARFAAVVGIIGFIDVPIVYMARGVVADAPPQRSRRPAVRVGLAGAKHVLSVPLLPGDLRRHLHSSPARPRAAAPG